MLIITESGKRYLQTLQQKERDHDIYMAEVNRDYKYSEMTQQGRKRLLQRVNSRLYRFMPQLFILRVLEESGPKQRTDFYFPKETPLQEGWRRRHDQAKEHTVDELVAKGYVTEVK